MYLLDTNILSELCRREPDRVVMTRFESALQEELFTSAICIEEIVFGSKSASPGNRIWERFENEVLPWLEVIRFDWDAALICGSFRGDWKRQGTPVDYADALIAATAKSREMILVTRNTRHFDHINGLRLENWFMQTAQN